MKYIVIAALLVTSIPAAQAVTISLNELPTEVQNCSTCFVGLQSSVDFQGMSAHRYLNSAPSSLFDGWLIRYSLAAPSRNTSSYEPPYLGEPMGPITTVTPYSGNIWLQASDSYNLANSNHQFKIFADTAMPAPFNYYNGYNATGTGPANPGVTTLTLTTADLLAGSGFVHAAGEFGNYTVEGSLSRSMFTCVECGWTTDFNLVFLDYSSGMLNFNPDEQRNLLFSQSDYWVNFSNQDQFYVQAVPLPAALPLLGTGLSLLATSGFRRRKKIKAS
jgi:hypothetical protein